ncbi:hypothetical protein [Anaeromyxobacter sp. SG26]|uniref:hypothetical protein n=1 Tax=Anaeromyxobacter sp. SG26 TaxID=2925407 RepID=UPI001F5A6A61|nr:hypothetical protein [Anaeromyxobacter sp. SG26]
MKTLRVDVDAKSWGAGTPPPSLLGVASAAYKVDILRVLVQIARCTAPLGGFGFDLSSYWAWLRYFPAIADGSELILRDEWSDIDPHQKTILSDDFGMGLPCTILTDALDLAFICPTTYFVDRLATVAPAHVQLGAAGKRGPAKSPDFLGLDSAGRVHVIECKGTQRRERLWAAMNDGIPQKRNVSVLPKKYRGEALVAGLYIPQHNGGQALCCIADPHEDAPDATKITLEEGDAERVSWAAEMASTLHLMGAATVSRAYAVAEWSLESARVFRRTIDQFARITALDHDLVINHRDISFPRPLGSAGDLQVHGLRLSVGLETSTLDVIASGQLPRADASVHRRAERSRTSRRAETLYEELSAGGSYFGLELLTQPLR